MQYPPGAWRRTSGEDSPHNISVMLGAASVTAVNRLGFGRRSTLGVADEIQVVRIGMTNAVLTDPLHEATIGSPMEGPVPHVVMTGVMNHAVRSDAIARRVDAQTTARGVNQVVRLRHRCIRLGRFPRLDQRRESGGSTCASPALSN